jgi:hypothetical protein
MSSEWNGAGAFGDPPFGHQHPIDLKAYRPRGVGLSHETIDNIIRQKQQYLAFKQDLDEKIWGDPDFRPGPMVERIADRLTLGLIKDGTDLLEVTCDQFIDCLVRSEFFPDEMRL